MYQLKPAINPQTTSRLLASLNFAIEEAKIVKLITAASDQKHLLQQNNAGPDRVAYLSREIVLLEDKLDDIRNQAREFADI